MIAVDYSDPYWLQNLLERALAERWCYTISCTTCGSMHLRQALGLLDKPAPGRPRLLPMRPETADAIIDGLRACDPEPRNRGEMAAAARWVIYQVWHAYGDAYFDRLAGTWAETVLEGMRAHHATRIEARRIHEERQGVKQRDWKR